MIKSILEIGTIVVFTKCKHESWKLSAYQTSRVKNWSLIHTKDLKAKMCCPLHIQVPKLFKHWNNSCFVSIPESGRSCAAPGWQHDQMFFCRCCSQTASFHCETFWHEPPVHGKLKIPRTQFAHNCTRQWSQSDKVKAVKYVCTWHNSFASCTTSFKPLILA